MKTAAAYIRVSTDDQAEFSPASQLKAIRRYAETNGYLLPENLIFSDTGISGRNADKRPGFQNMIAAAKLSPPPFSVVLIWKFSRFARSRQDSIIYKSLLRRQCKIDVISVTEQLSADNTSVLIEALIEAMDEYYSLNLAEEVRRGMQEKFSRGGVISQPPFGYIMGKNRFEPDPENAPVVRYIFASYISGMSMNQIAQKLNSMHLTTVRGNPFERRSIEYILTNPVYAGKLRRSINSHDRSDRFHQNPQNTAISQGKHEPLISDEDFNRVQELYRKSRRTKYCSANCSENPEQLFRGLVHCSTCGATLVYQKGTGCLQCHNYAKGRCEVSHAISAKKLESAVINRICKDFQGVIEITIPKCPDVKMPISELISRQEKMLEKARSAYCSGVDTLEEYSFQKKQILQNIESIRNHETSTLDIQKKLYIKTEILCSETVDIQLKSIILHALIKSIILFRPCNRLEIDYIP